MVDAGGNSRKILIAYFRFMETAFPVKTICVCGAGTMGSGIAQLAAQSGFQTILFDVNEAMLEKSRDQIRQNLQVLAGKGKLDAAEMEQTLARLGFTSEITRCKADLIIEAIVENKDAKTVLFRELAAQNENDTIFASNTSSLSVAAIAAATAFPQRVVGMHFFNPAPLMKLVEIVQTLLTDTAVVATVAAVAVRMGKTAVVCRDAPGFIVNRVARPYYLEALQLLEDGSADIPAIDTVMEATGFKMGPFKLMDLIGLDINYRVSHIVWEALGRPLRLTPSDIQRKKVEDGELGRKTGKGFYES